MSSLLLKPATAKTTSDFLSLRDQLEQALLKAATAHYGERLASLVVYGSAGRGTIHPDSDLDILIVLDPWKNDYPFYCHEFSLVEAETAPALQACRAQGWQVHLSPVFKGCAAVEYGSPLFLDMTDDARILFDRDGYFARRLDRLRERLCALGSQRIWEGDSWYWDLKPDWKPGDVIEL